MRETESGKKRGEERRGEKGGRVPHTRTTSSAHQSSASITATFRNSPIVFMFSCASNRSQATAQVMDIEMDTAVEMGSCSPEQV